MYCIVKVDEGPKVEEEAAEVEVATEEENDGKEAVKKNKRFLVFGELYLCSRIIYLRHRPCNEHDDKGCRRQCRGGGWGGKCRGDGGGSQGRCIVL